MPPEMDSPITPLDLHAYLLRLHRLDGPVGIYLNEDGSIRSFDIQHNSKKMRYRIVLERREALTRFTARLLHRALAAWFDDHDLTLTGKLDWRRPKVAIRRVLSEAVARLSVHRANNNTLREADPVEITFHPMQIGTKTQIKIGSYESAFLYPGDEASALAEAKDIIRDHTTAMGELL